uniref:CSON008394 protein n=2 Tax=Culicoides sonorensis TaxID=179676 RepID=A0A336LBY5_CULSO
MKTFIILLAVFVLCTIAWTPESSSEESSSSEEEEIAPIQVTTENQDEVLSESDESDVSDSSSEEVIHFRSGRSRNQRRPKNSKNVRGERKNPYQRADNDTRWEKYKIQFNLKFSSAAKEAKAKRRFIKNRMKVIKHKDDNKNSTIDLEVNQFATMSSKEFRSKMMGLTPETRPEVRSYFSEDITRQSVPDSFDARTIPGAVSLVRAQGDCGGCWAFSTVATLETIFFMKYKKTYKLSEKHLIDCDGFNDGCDGGTMDAAFNYIRGYEGINARKMYPYQEFRSRCVAQKSYNRPIFITEIKGFPKPQKEKPEVVEEMMKVATATYGAVAVGIDAEYMQFYGGGVYTGPCTPGINHGVTIVGYGTCEKTGLPYWIIKNSWGPEWGEAGFLRLYRGNNTCGVGQMASVPIIADDIDLTRVPTDDQVDAS